MTSNPSLSLSLSFKSALQGNLLSAFKEDFPNEAVSSYLQTRLQNKIREKVYTPVNTLLTMLLSSIQEDKSLQKSVNLFKQVYEEQGEKLRQEELVLLEKEKQADQMQYIPRAGRPKVYKSKLSKSKTHKLSDSTVAYSNARKRLPCDLVQLVFSHSTNFEGLEKEQWHGLKTYSTDGTYLQLQDTEDIRKEYPPVESNGMFPQALLQVFIRQGSGQISKYAIGNRKQSELQLVIPMIKELNPGDLLLADDLYNTYYHFCLALAQGAHMIVPGKRDRNYTVIRKIGENDEIVEIKKSNSPDYVDKETWAKLPSSIQLRRITYGYPTKEGAQQCVLYSTLTTEEIHAVDIVLKYATRWDIEISIREIKTLMDINVLRGKSPDILKKELGMSLTAYNLVRKIIARSVDKTDFSPQEDIFQKCAQIGSPLLIDKKGRIFHRWSTGRYGKTHGTNKETSHS